MVSLFHSVSVPCSKKYLVWLSSMELNKLSFNIVTRFEHFGPIRLLFKGSGDFGFFITMHLGLLFNLKTVSKRFLLF